MSFDVGKTIVCDHIDYTGKSWGAANEIMGCPKCLGQESYYDISFSSASGAVNKVEGVDLLEELVMKVVLTGVGDNPFHLEYGTSIRDSIGALNSYESFARVIEFEIERGSSLLYLNQQLQLQLGQTMSDDELIHSIGNIQLDFVTERLLKIRMQVVAESGKDIEFVV